MNKLTKYAVVWSMSFFAIFAPSSLGVGQSLYSLIPVATQAPQERIEASVIERDPTLVALVDKLEAKECAKRFVSVEYRDPNPFVEAGYECKGNHQNWDVHSNSYGSMQFKDPTFIRALKDLEEWDGQTYEARVEIMKDRGESKRIAVDWIDQDFDNVYNWTTYKKVK